MMNTDKSQSQRNGKYTGILNEYDFAEDNFDTLPAEIFQLDHKKLLKNDSVILDAIKFQMKVSKYNEIYQTINYGIMNHELRIRNHASNFFRPIIHTSYSIIQTPAQLLQTVYSGVAFTIMFFVFVSFVYYANVNLNLGMNFLTELFA